MNDLIRSARSRRNLVGSTGVGTVKLTEPPTPANVTMNSIIRDARQPLREARADDLADAQTEYERAVASRDPARIEEADRRVEAVLADARAAARQPQGDAFVNDLRRRAAHRRGQLP